MFLLNRTYTRKTTLGQQPALEPAGNRGNLPALRNKNMDDYATLTFLVRGTASLTPESRTLNHQSMSVCSETDGSSAHQHGGRAKMNNFPALYGNSVNSVSRGALKKMAILNIQGYNGGRFRKNAGNLPAIKKAARAIWEHWEKKGAGL